MKEIIELLKDTNKRVYIFITLILVIINVEFLRNLKENKTAIIDSLHIIVQNLISIIPVVVVIVLWKLLLRKSDQKSKKDIQDYLSKTEDYVFENDLARVEVNENYIISSSSSKNIMEIVIKNNQEENIECLKGVISLYYRKIRIKKIEININNLSTGIGERVFLDRFDERWNQCDLYITEVNYSRKTDKNILLRGGYRFYTDFYILNLDKFYDYRIMGFRVNSNLKWLKEEMDDKFNIISRLYKKSYFTSKHSFLTNLISKLIQTFFFVLIYTLILTSVVLFVIAITNIIYCSIELFNIWISVLKNNINQNKT